VPAGEQARRSTLRPRILCNGAEGTKKKAPNRVLALPDLEHYGANLNPFNTLRNLIFRSARVILQVWPGYDSPGCELVIVRLLRKHHNEFSSERNGSWAAQIHSGNLKPSSRSGQKVLRLCSGSNPYDVPVVVKRVEKLPAKFLAATAKKGFLQEAQDALGAMVREKSLRPLVITSEGGQVVQAAGVGDMGEGPVELQPGNSTVRVFTIRTSNAIFFAPSLYNLNLVVEVRDRRKVESRHRRIPDERSRATFRDDLRFDCWLRNWLSGQSC
jgi:hypothetical protein